jgi:2,3-bisphosphoglycerate-dependent phosphoglycerate mutase
MSSNEQKWPDWLWIVRHGQSESNVARKLAEEAAREHIGISVRDVDVPLSELGLAQARAVGASLGALPAAERPNVILVSPYRRAVQTAQAISEAAGIQVSREDGTYVVDERLREKEFGVLTGLTRSGIASLHPHEYELRMLFGKFYHRPPGGESYCDVIMRLRSILGTIAREHGRGDRVLIVCHSVVVNCFRYLLERMTEEEIMEEDRVNEVWNCSVTSYRYDGSGGRRGQGGLVRAQCNDVGPLIRAGVGVS